MAIYFFQKYLKVNRTAVEEEEELDQDGWKMQRRIYGR
jgi:hypothetical protein